MCRVYSVNVREKGVCTFSGIDVDVGNNIVKQNWTSEGSISRRRCRRRRVKSLHTDWRSK